MDADRKVTGKKTQSLAYATLCRKMRGNTMRGNRNEMMCLNLPTKAIR